MDEHEKLQTLLDSGLCEYCELISRTSGIDTVFRFRGGVEISHPDRDRAINLAYAYLKEQTEYKAMQDYLIEVYELILSRVGAEQKLSPNPNVSFAACLPTKHVIRLEEIVTTLKALPKTED